MSDVVLVEHRDGVQIVTINRPEARNAVNRAVAEGLAAAMDELDARPDLVVGVVTGAGGTFCAGMDLKAFVAGEDPVIAGRGFAGITVEASRKPLIAAVEGWALAGGCEIALACDMIVAAETAKFGIPEVKRGLVAAAGGLLKLPRKIPVALAYELALTGDPLTAEAAHRLGLVNTLTPTGGALEAALALAARITPNGPLALAATKQVLDFASTHGLADGWRMQAEVVPGVFASNDAREGAVAFAEKRAPRWTAT
jgi:enoyl-CoA hydratase